MPRVSLIAQRQDSDVGFDNLPINRTDNTYIGLDISIPIYAGGANRASVSEALSQRNIVEYELRAIQLQVRERVRGAHLQVQASGVQTQAAEILVESTALASEAMQQGFALGTVTSVDVLNALRDQYQAEREFQRTRYEHIRYLLLLKRETGTLSAEDMLEIGSWLEPPQP
jgi:outer membrane protein